MDKQQAKGAIKGLNLLIHFGGQAVGQRCNKRIKVVVHFGEQTVGQRCNKRIKVGQLLLLDKCARNYLIAQ